MGELLRTVGWKLHIRRSGWMLRIRHQLTLAALTASIGTAVGYAVATRGVVDEDADPDRLD